MASNASGSVAEHEQGLVSRLYDRFMVPVFGPKREITVVSLERVGTVNTVIPIPSKLESNYPGGHGLGFENSIIVARAVYRVQAMVEGRQLSREYQVSDLSIGANPNSYDLEEMAGSAQGTVFQIRMKDDRLPGGLLNALYRQMAPQVKNI